MHAGNIEMDLLDVLRTARWIWYRYQLSRSRIHSLEPAKFIWDFVDHEHGRWRRAQSYKCTLIDLLVSTRLYHLYISHDHVYGLLGLYKLCVSPQVPSSLRPDYAKDLRQLFRDATRIAVESAYGCGLHYLSVISHHDDDSAIVPSWVPAWHHDRNFARDPHQFDAVARADDGEPTKCYNLPGNQDVLGVQG